MNEEQAAEVSRLEEEAKVKAAKHVANMLQRPDQLEKVRNECVENLANDNGDHISYSDNTRYIN